MAPNGNVLNKFYILHSGKMSPPLYSLCLYLLRVPNHAVL